MTLHIVGYLGSIRWFFMIFVLAVAHLGAAQDMPSNVEICLNLGSKDWSEAEGFVWRKSCHGDVADLNIRDGRKLDPGKPDGWGNGHRDISPKFLETVLLQKRFQDAVTRHGVRIIGAYFPDRVDLGSGILPWQLWIGASRFEKDLDMSNLRTSRLVRLERSFIGSDLLLIAAEIGSNLNLSLVEVTNELVLDSASIDGSLFLDGAVFTNGDFKGVSVEKQFAMPGVTIRENMFMDSATVGGSLLMQKTKVGKEITLRAVKVANKLDMSETQVLRELNMDSVSIGGSLHMRGATLANAWLLGAEVGQQVNMDGARVETLTMDLASVGANLSMDFATFEKGITLRSADVKNQVSMVRTVVKGKLNMNAATIGTALIMGSRCNSVGNNKYGRRNGESLFGRVDLGAIRIARQLDMTGATVTGRLNLDSAEVGGDVFIRREPIRVNNALCDGRGNFSEINLIFAEVGSNIDLTGGTFRSIDLSGTEVQNELRLTTAIDILGSEGRTELRQENWVPEWANSSDEVALNLQNTVVGALVDSPDSWPHAVELRGLVYDRLGGFKTTAERSAGELVEWLGRDKTFSFQPYEQLASVLRKVGRAETADAVLYASKERERSGEGANKLWFFALKWIIGYGIGLYMFRALYWAVAFLLLGWALLVLTGENNRHTATLGGPIGFWFSLDYLLPIIRLREFHFEKVDLSVPIRYYFYVHQVVGYILASFVIAGFSALIR